MRLCDCYITRLRNIQTCIHVSIYFLLSFFVKPVSFRGIISSLIMRVSESLEGHSFILSHLNFFSFLFGFKLSFRILVYFFSFLFSFVTSLYILLQYPLLLPSTYDLSPFLSRPSHPIIHLALQNISSFA